MLIPGTVIVACQRPREILASPLAFPTLELIFKCTCPRACLSIVPLTVRWPWVQLWSGSTTVMNATSSVPHPASTAVALAPVIFRCAATSEVTVSVDVAVVVLPPASIAVLSRLSPVTAGAALLTVTLAEAEPLPSSSSVTVAVIAKAPVGWPAR